MTSVYIERWTKAAGINRKVTFHAFRRSYATGLITGGVDLYTVQRMLRAFRRSANPNLCTSG